MVHTGTYREISGFNNVDISVQVFTEELNQPFPITNDYFTQQYTDVFTNTLTLTVSMPVKLSINNYTDSINNHTDSINNHTDSISNHTDFIGALGIDLSGDDIRQIVKEHEVSLFSVCCSMIIVLVLKSPSIHLSIHSSIYSFIYLFSGQMDQWMD